MISSLFAAMAVGCALGAAVCYWRCSASAKSRKRIPKEWPLQARPLVSSQQQRVWTWLSKVMFEHQVLVKVPITRFTRPVGNSDARQWYALLNGVYCDFTVCDALGRVAGCLDIQGPKTPSMSNQILKQSLLSQCGIQYWVVDPDKLPPLVALRTAFLGERAAKDSSLDELDSRFNDGRESLQAAVQKLRRSKTKKLSPASLPRDDAQFSASRPGSGWDQNSFVTPLDSRTMDLGK